MALRIDDKKDIVTQLAACAKESSTIGVADYQGLTARQMVELRSAARKAGVHLQIVRNTLARRALKDTDFAGLESKLVGANLLALAQEDIAAPARLFREAAKEYETLQVRALALGKEIFDANMLDQIADLPNKEQAIAMFLSVISAPMTSLVRTISETYARLVRVLNVISESK